MDKRDWTREWDDGDMVELYGYACFYRHNSDCDYGIEFIRVRTYVEPCEDCDSDLVFEDERSHDLPRSWLCDTCEGRGLTECQDWNDVLTDDVFWSMVRQQDYLEKRYGTKAPPSIADYWLPAQDTRL